jgi:hypothetical protein
VLRSWSEEVAPVPSPPSFTEGDDPAADASPASPAADAAAASPASPAFSPTSRWRYLQRTKSKNDAVSPGRYCSPRHKMPFN